VDQSRLGIRDQGSGIRDRGPGIRDWGWGLTMDQGQGITIRKCAERHGIAEQSRAFVWWGVVTVTHQEPVKGGP